MPGKEEYLDSEKYEIKAWDWDRPGNIRADIALLNRLRREQPGAAAASPTSLLQRLERQHPLYGKMTPASDNFVLVAVNLDPHNAQGAHFEVPLWEFGLADRGRRSRSRIW